MVVNKHKKMIIFLGILLLLVGVSLFIITQRDTSQNNITKHGESDINFAPPTLEEKKQADENKSRIVENEQKRTSQSQPTIVNKTVVTPEITTAEMIEGSLELGSYVPGIFENNGTCTAALTKNTVTITRQVKSVAEGRDTFCPLFKIAMDEFQQKGSWQVKISYSSDAYTGSSVTKMVEIK